MMLELYRQYQISLNLKKCVFCAPFGALLGHVVCRDGIFVHLTKILIILNLQPPTTVKQLRETLEHTGYYRIFVKGYLKVTALMENLLKKDAQLQWIES